MGVHAQGRQQEAAPWSSWKPKNEKHWERETYTGFETTEPLIDV